MIELSPSKKTFNKTKCDHPANTIKRISNGFKKLSLLLNYKPIKFGDQKNNLWSGMVEIPGTGISANGKGSSHLLSKASAYAELAERFSAGFAPPSHIDSCNKISLGPKFDRRLFLPGAIRGKLQTIQNDTIIFDQFFKKMAFDGSQIEAIAKHDYSKTWVDGYELPTNKKVKIPIMLVEFISWSNGLASGNTLEEAIAQALCEAIERYTVAQILFRKKSAPTINPDSIDDPQIKKYIKLFESLNCSIKIKDFSLNKGYPSIGIIITDSDAIKSPNPYTRRLARRVRVGCAPDIKTALMRCFTEEIQGSSVKEYKTERYKCNEAFWDEWALKSSDTFPLPLDDDKRMFVFRKYDYLENLDFLYADKKVCDFGDLPNFFSDDAMRDIDFLTSIIRKNHFKIYVVDSTHPVLKFPVVRVIIPGMSDALDYLNPKCIDSDGIHDFLLGWDTNLLKYFKSDKWIKSSRKITNLLDKLENYFNMYGCQVYYEDKWLFYTAYRLSLFTNNPNRSIKYLKVIRKVLGRESREDDTLSSAMLLYLANQAKGISPKENLSKISKRYGLAWRKRVGVIIHDHDLENSEVINPFNGEDTKSPKHFSRWAKSFFN